MTATMLDAYGRSAEEREALKAQKEQLNAAAQENWEDDQWRKSMARAITQQMYEGFLHENLISLLSDTERVGFNDRVTVSEVRGLRAFWVARGGYIESSEMKRSTVEVPRDTIGFHVHMHEDKIRNNFAETQSTLIERGQQRLDAEVNARFLATLQAAIPSTSPYYISGAGLDLTTLNAALTEVKDSTRSRTIALVGRATMTDQIINELLGNSAGYFPETNEAMLRRGVLGTYRGARIVELINYVDDQEISFFPDNELFVVTPDSSKTVFYGTPLSKEFVEDDNWYWHYLARQDNGLLVHHPERVRRIVDTSL